MNGRARSVHGRGLGVQAQCTVRELGTGIWPGQRDRCTTGTRCMAAGAGSVPGPAWGGGTPSCWSAESVQNRAGSVTEGRSTAGGSGWGNTGHRDPRAGGAATGTAPTIPPPLSRSQHRVAGSPAPSMTSPVGLLSVVPSRAPGFSQHIQPGCGEMRLCSSPGAGTHQHPPVWGPWKGDAPRGSIPGGNSLPKGTHSSRGLTSHNHSTTCGEFSVSKALEKKFGIPLN